MGLRSPPPICEKPASHTGVDQRRRVHFPIRVKIQRMSGVEFYLITNEWIIIRLLDRRFHEKHMRRLCLSSLGPKSHLK